MPSVTQSYPLKLPQDPQFRQRIDWLLEVNAHAGQQLLEALWTENWLDLLHASSKKAYKVIGEQQVQLSMYNQLVYLPSRIRRSIAEQVGRILRSQADRKNCYYNVLQIVQITGVEGKLDTLVRIVGLTLSRLHGKYYRWALIRQTLRTFRRYHYKLGLDLTVLTQIPYTKQVHPTIRHSIFPYAPDDGQTIKITWQDAHLSVQMKLPKTAFPTKPQDWAWCDVSLALPPKILQRLPVKSSKLHRPTLRYFVLKGGLRLPFLEFAWTITRKPDLQLKGARVLATDLGLVNLTTSVIVEAGSQISPPVFWSPAKRLFQNIDQLYHHLANLQRKLDRYPPQWRGQGRRCQERERLYQKLNRYREELLHLTSNQLLATAVQWHCQTIVLEDLRTYDPPKNKRKLSRKLSTGLRGSLYGLLRYKAKRLGITIRRVSPRWTSSYCPRCGQKGLKITDSRMRKRNPRGRMFQCPSCGFLADRDYIAALNISRMFHEQR
ncbi:MAG: RNA-guided endonuclease InsQ/TnpB family protein [Candidatus Heimdallarchaeota archaeon]